MTIDQAIERCDEMKPNSYDREDKIRWLSELDGRITADILLTHEAAPGETAQGAFPGYDSATDGGTELLVKAPYEDVYIKYLFSQIDFNNAEFTRYNNSAAMFSAVYAAFADAYNRTHMPIQNHSISGI